MQQQHRPPPPPMSRDAFSGLTDSSSCSLAAAADASINIAHIQSTPAAAILQVFFTLFFNAPSE